MGSRPSCEAPRRVAIIDIGMPGMDGYEVARRVRQLPDSDSILLIAVTGFGQEDDRTGALGAGFNAHLVKPVDLSQLSAVVTRSGKSLGAIRPSWRDESRFDRSRRTVHGSQQTGVPDRNKLSTVSLGAVIAVAGLQNCQRSRPPLSISKRGATNRFPLDMNESSVAVRSA